MCSKEETEILNRNSKKSEQLKKKLLAVGGGDPRNQKQGVVCATHFMMCTDYSQTLSGLSESF